MRFRTAIKILSLVLLGISSSLITSSVMARGDKKKQKSTTTVSKGITADRPASTVFQFPDEESNAVRPVFKGNKIRAFAPSVNAMVPGILRASGKTTAIWELRVDTEGRGLYRITGLANVNYARQDAEFAWALRVRNMTSRDIVSEKLYDDQVFNMVEPRDSTTCTFEDLLSIDLDSGTYVVELILFRVPDIGVEGLVNTNLQRSHELAKNSYKLVIAN